MREQVAVQRPTNLHYKHLQSKAGRQKWPDEIPGDVRWFYPIRITDSCKWRPRESMKCIRTETKVTSELIPATSTVIPFKVNQKWPHYRLRREAVGIFTDYVYNVYTYFFSWAGFVYPQSLGLLHYREFLNKRKSYICAFYHQKSTTHNVRYFPLSAVQSKSKPAPVTFKSIAFEDDVVLWWQPSLPASYTDNTSRLLCSFRLNSSVSWLVFHVRRSGLLLPESAVFPMKVVCPWALLRTPDQRFFARFCPAKVETGQSQQLPLFKFWNKFFRLSESLSFQAWCLFSGVDCLRKTTQNQKSPRNVLRKLGHNIRCT